MLQIARRMAQIPFSAIRTMLERVTRLEQDGADIIHMEVGRPDFDTPDHIKQACHQALDEGVVHYTSNYGIFPLRQAISDKLKTDNQLDFDPESEIIVTAGVSQGIVATMMALLNPGDEVLLMSPLFPAYATAAHMADAIPVTMPVFKENDYQPQLCDLAACTTSRTKMIVITTPGNPSGTVMSQQTMQAIADFAIEHDLLVMSDEIYEKLIYDGNKHISIASLPGMRERTITLNGFSKSYAMTGWRLGYIAADAPLTDAIVRIHQNIVVCANTFSQWGGVAALTQSQQPMSDMVAEFDRRRLLMIDRLGQIEQLSFVRPQGAMYVYVDVTNTGLDAYQLADELLTEANVSVVPWDAEHIRLSYGNSYDNLQRALVRISEYFLRKDKINEPTTSNIMG